MYKIVEAGCMSCFFFNIFLFQLQLSYLCTMEKVFGKEDALKNFLTIGKLEGYSFLVLLFIAMPLKYVFHHPEAVRIAGMLHGFLFILFMITIVILYQNKQISIKNSLMAVLYSIIPFGTVFLRRLVG